MYTNILCCFPLERVSTGVEGTSAGASGRRWARSLSPFQQLHPPPRRGPRGRGGRGGRAPGRPSARRRRRAEPWQSRPRRRPPVIAAGTTGTTRPGACHWTRPRSTPLPRGRRGAAAGLPDSLRPSAFLFLLLLMMMLRHSSRKRAVQPRSIDNVYATPCPASVCSTAWQYRVAADACGFVGRQPADTAASRDCLPVRRPAG